MLRNRVILLLSLKAGLRAKEIANLTWDMITDSEGSLGSAIQLQNVASKGAAGGRVIPLNRDLKKALERLYRLRGALPVNRRAILTPSSGSSASNFDPSPGW